MADIVSQLAKPKVVVGLAALTSAGFHRRPGVGARLLASIPLTLGASTVLKRLNPEQRPRIWDRHPRQSFPSSHSSVTTAYLLALVDSFAAWWALPIAGTVIAAVNVARVRDRQHWLKDVLCGDVIGVLGAATGAIAARAWLRRRGPEAAPRPVRNRRRTRLPRTTALHSKQSVSYSVPSSATAAGRDYELTACLGAILRATISPSECIVPSTRGRLVLRSVLHSVAPPVRFAGIA